MEEFGNFAQTTLASGISSGSSTVSLTDASKFPLSGTFHLLIDDEILFVTDGSTYPYPVSRGREGTTADSHSSGATVTLSVTVEALDNFREDACESGIYASAPASPIHGGRIWLSTDSLFHVLDDETDGGGSGNVFTYGPLRKLTLPDLASYSWVNQGSAFSDDSNGALVLGIANGSNADNLRMLVKNIPATPFSITACIRVLWGDRDFLSGGIGLYESATGKFEGLQFNHSSDVNAAIDLSKWNSPTVGWNSNRVNFAISEHPAQIDWLKLYHDGTNIHAYFSVNGFNWYEIASFAKNNFLTTDADQYALYINTNNTGGIAGVWASYISIEEGTS